MPNVKELTHIPVLLIACVLLVVGVATNNWVSASVNNMGMEGKIFIGLFMFCTEGTVPGIKTTGCVDHDKEKASKGLVVTGIVIGGLVTLLMIAYIFVKDSNSDLKIMPKACGIGGIIGAVLIIIGAIIFALDADKNFDYDYSFYVTLVGAIVLIVGSALSLKA